MVYDASKPANDGFLADFPPEMREQLRAIIQDAIVDSGLLKGLAPGNAQGNIPVSNGNENKGLNAERHGGNLPSAYATAGHGHSVATGSSDGFYPNTHFAKVEGMQAGAEVNQMAFSNILAKGVTIQADSKTDTLEIVEGANISITPDATNDRLTIAATNVETPSGAQAKADAAKAYTDTKIANMINSAPLALDTLKELADAMGNDPNFAATITNSLAQKVGVNDSRLSDARPANGGTATYSTYQWSTSHPGNYYVSNAWDGTYWRFTSNHGAPVRVGYADSAGNANTVGGLTVDQIKTQSSTRVWVSPDFTPVTGTRYDIPHNISGLDVNIARAEIFLKCTIANNGYSTGDILSNPTFYYSSGFGAVPQTILTATTISMVPISSITYIYVRNRTTGANVSPSFASGWTLFFKIWY